MQLLMALETEGGKLNFRQQRENFNPKGMAGVDIITEGYFQHTVGDHLAGLLPTFRWLLNSETAGRIF